MFPETATDELKGLFSLTSRHRPCKDDTPEQGANCERNFEHGSLLRILLSIIILHARLSTVERQGGLFKETHSRNGRRAVLSCGFVVIVCFYHPPPLINIDPSSHFAAGVGKSVLWYATSRLLL